ncbi:phage portal protein [Pseudomonas putida]|nr:phage portal protein [Pseudomonas putida]
MNVIDRMLRPLFPGLVAKRLGAQHVIQAYEAADITRTHKAKGQARSADASLQKDARSMRAQCRKLDEDHDLVIGLLDRLEERVVGGPGIGVEPLPLDYAGAVHVDFAAAIKAAWAEWSLKPEVSGELTRPQVERLICRTWLRDGEALAQMLKGRVSGYDYQGGVPFALELLEPDYLPWEYNDLSKGIVQGVQRNAWRRVQAYYFYKRHPGDLLVHGLAENTKPVPADRVIHIAHRKRIGQNRGVPLLHGVITRLADIKDYEESERVAARISAALAMYIKKGSQDDYQVKPDGKERTIPIQSGMVYDGLNPGEEVGMIESNRPNPFLEPFRNGQLKAVAAGTRGTFSSVARSYDGTYSSQRQELVEGQQGYDLLQHEFIDYWSRPVYRNWLQMAILSGRLVVPPTVDPSTVYSAVYQGPVMPWINPVHEATAWNLLVDAGFADEAEVARSRGRNPAELKKSRIAEILVNRANGLVFGSDAYHKFYGNKGNADTAKNPADPATGGNQPGK